MRILSTKTRAPEKPFEKEKGATDGGDLCIVHQF